MGKPLTLDQIVLDGPPVRVRDLVALTGLSDATIRTDLRQGLLNGRGRINRPHSPYLVDRADARNYLAGLGIALPRRGVIATPIR